MELSFKDIEMARDRAKGVIFPSPLIHSQELSRMVGDEVFLKLENLQETGSFKVRGAYNRLIQLDEKERKRGVLAASAGNHALGVAWACSMLGINATIVMPEGASIRKLVAVKEYGTEVVLMGSYYHEAYSHASTLSEERGIVMIHAYDDPFVIAGQGTIGIELSEALQKDTAIVVPVGGGGLISGIAISAKALQPDISIIGVQSDSCPSTIQSLAAKRPVEVEIGPTLADGIAVKQPGDLTFSLMEKYVDDMVSVNDEGIAGALLSLLEKAHVLAEGAGAAPLAAVTENASFIRAKRYILIVSGGNIETHMMDRILHRGSIRMGRLIRISVNLLDAPGSLSKLLGIIAAGRANILHIFHDRLALDNPIQVSRVELNLETRGPDHADEIIESLKKAGYELIKII